MAPITQASTTNMHAAAGSHSKRDLKSRSRQNHVPHGPEVQLHGTKTKHLQIRADARGGREEILAQEQKLKLSEIRLGNNTCGANTVMDFETSKCRPKSRKKSISWVEKAKKLTVVNKKFRIPLKKEQHEFRNEYIEYDAEFPHRVGIRLEYLMGNTKVRLNDRAYMNRLYEALAREEEFNLIKLEFDRQQVERKRVKKLVVEGEAAPPEELRYLYEHPVFKVNAMLRRLEKQDDHFSGAPAHDNGVMVLCEPFEYNSSKFFVHLHRTGKRDWVPNSVKKAARQKRREKLARARVRRELKLAKKKEVEEFKLLYKTDERRSTLLNKMKSSTVSGLSDDDDSSPDEDLGKVELGGNKQPEHDPHEHNLKRTNSEDAHINGKLVVEQLVAESIEQRERELARKRLYREKEQRQDARLRARELTRRKNDAAKNRVSKESISVSDWFIDEPVTPPNVKDDQSLELLRKSYKIHGDAYVEQYRIRRGPIISKYIDDVEEPETLFKNGQELKLLYQREQMVCEKFMRKLNLFNR